MSIRKLLPALILLFCSLLPLPSLAGQGVSLEQAVSQVKKQTGGRILRAETRKKDGHKVYFIKVLLPDGRIRVVTIEAGK